MSPPTRSLGEQISSVNTAKRILLGAVKLPHDEAQRVYLNDCLSKAIETLEWVREHEASTDALKTFEERIRR